MVNKGKYVEPWSRQKELQRRFSDEELLDIDELAEIIGNINYGKVQVLKQTKRARALVAMYYLTGCRVSELTKVDSLRRQSIKKRTVIDKHGRKGVIYKVDEFGDVERDQWIEEHDFGGIRKKDIGFRLIDGRRCMLIRTENRKNRKRLTKRQPIPIALEKSIVFYLHDYVKHLKDDSILFPFKSKRATQIINDCTGFNIHFLRHIRATHLITKYDFNEQMLVKFMGWADARPAKYYIELKSHDIFRQFYKRRG